MPDPSVLCASIIELVARGLGPSHLRPGYSEIQLRQLTRGMEGGPVSWAIAGLGLALALLFVLLAAAAMQDRVDTRADPWRPAGPGRAGRGRRVPVSREERIWRRRSPVPSRPAPRAPDSAPGPAARV